MKKKIIAVASVFCLSVASLGMVDLRVSAQEKLLFRGMHKSL